jgi:hypothetical protein
MRVIFNGTHERWSSVAAALVQLSGGRGRAQRVGRRSADQRLDGGAQLGRWTVEQAFELSRIERAIAWSDDK